MTEHTHRYGEPEQTPGESTEHTTALPFRFDSDEPQPPSGPPPRRGGGRRRTAGILVAALIVGGAGGVGGAALFDAFDEDDGGATTATRTAGSSSPLRTSDTSSDTPAPDGSPEAVANSVLPSVVMINVVTESGSGGSGSGIILSEDGEILTNDHVVDVAADGGKITVSFEDGSTAPASVVGTDPVTDVAVIQAEGVSGLTPAVLGNSDDLGVGEAVVAIGSPFGLEATVTSGIVSSLNRPVSVGSQQEEPQAPNPLDPEEEPDPQREAIDSTTYPAIQTDAAINPGNSGGPLVNLAGEVVGVNSSIRTSTSSLGGEGGSIGLGFAIPISKVLPIVEQLRNQETPTHARLGVTVSNSVGDNGLVMGASIKEVQEGSAGEEAGLEADDVVIRVNDEPITGVESLVATIRGYRPGDEVTLVISRDGDEKELTATLDSDAEDDES